MTKEYKKRMFELIDEIKKRVEEWTPHMSSYPLKEDIIYFIGYLDAIRNDTEPKP